MQSVVERAMKRASAEVIMPRWRALRLEDILRKAGGDLVTIADREAEEVIINELRSSFPDAVFFGEEAFEAQPSLLRQFESADHAFTIDPIDGTSHFVNGAETFGVMVGEVIRGEVVRGWIWQPVSGHMYEAERGGGIRVNGAPLVRRRSLEHSDSLYGASGFADAITNGLGSDLIAQEKTVCCAIDYPRLIEGELDFLIYPESWAWDHAPGSLFIEELGGTFDFRDGSAYEPKVMSSHGIFATVS